MIDAKIPVEEFAVLTQMYNIQVFLTQLSG